MGPVRFLFDFISPYAYLAWTQIYALAGRHGRAVEPVPVLFAALLNEHGQKGPAEIEAKRRFTFRDVVRKALVLGVPLAPPASHPFNPLLALRVASLDAPAPDRRRAIDALFSATWAGSVDVTAPGPVGAALSAAGLDGPSLVARAGEPAAKTRLREATEAAIADGAFGVPTMLCDGELFWGTDSLPFLERFVAGEDPLRPEHEALWKHIRPSAVRKA